MSTQYTEAQITSMPAPKLKQAAANLKVKTEGVSIPDLRKAVIAALKKGDAPAKAAPAAAKGKPAAAPPKATTAAPAKKGGAPAKAAPAAAKPERGPAPLKKGTTAPASATVKAEPKDDALAVIQKALADLQTVVARIQDDVEALKTAAATAPAPVEAGEDEVDLLADYRDAEGNIVVEAEQIDAMDLKTMVALCAETEIDVPESVKGVPRMRAFLKKKIEEASAGADDASDGEAEEGATAEGPNGEQYTPWNHDELFELLEEGHAVYLELEGEWMLGTVTERTADADGDPCIVFDVDGKPFTVYKEEQSTVIMKGTAVEEASE